MKKTAVELENAKLKKQLEKLEQTKTELRKEVKSLKGKLATAKSKAVKTKPAFKKKDLEKLPFNEEVMEIVMSVLGDTSTPRQ